MKCKKEREEKKRKKKDMSCDYFYCTVYCVGSYDIRFSDFTIFYTLMS
jgi:hypothetical protein